MLRHNFKPNKKLDQYFIIDKKVIDLVVCLLDLNKKDVVLEVGSGTGFLTKELVSKVDNLTIVEKDKKMVDVIKEEIDLKDTKIINKDFLDVDLSKINPTKIVSFVPYSISQQMIYKINTFAKSVLVLQKEFAEKLVAIEGCENYNAVSVLAQYYNSISLKKTVFKNSFFPKPNCESSIVVIDPNNNKYSEDFNLFIKTIFRYSKKNLLKAINLSIDQINIKTENIQKISKKDLSTKVKQITPKKFKEVYNVIH
jgi:16S rRNA (adenine1518-N6/adenine1519-N6)-dimethyltransferase